MNAQVDRRILGAFRCVDAITGNAIAQPFAVSAAGWSLKPNRSGVYVIFSGPDLGALTTQFILSATPWPAPAAFDVTIDDPSHRYLPRRAAIQAPFAAPVVQKVTMFPAPSAATGPSWSVVRVSVVDATTKAGLPRAVVRITSDSAATKIGPGGAGVTGVTDARGEALVAVTGLKLHIGQNGNGLVAVTLKAWFDPSVTTRPPGWIANPDDILSNLSSATLKSATQTAQLGAGGDQTIAVPITV